MRQGPKVWRKFQRGNAPKKKQLDFIVSLTNGTLVETTGVWVDGKGWVTAHQQTLPWVAIEFWSDPKEEARV